MEFSKYSLFLTLCATAFEGAPAQKNVFVTLSSRPSSVTDKINAQTFNSRAEKILALRSALIAHSTQTQLPLVKFLETTSLFGKLNYESFWISNEIFIKEAPTRVLSSLTNLFGGAIASITEETFATFQTDFVPSPKQGNSAGYTWGVTKVQAPDAWNMGFDGTGSIVGGIDTGVLWTHDALRENYLGDGGWCDPSASTKSQYPYDTNGHGTHTMGTIAGGRGIGVAPGARWISCRGCAGNSCAESDLKACGQFMICPTDYDCKSRCNAANTPDVVNNSWGGSILSDSYLDMVKNWIAVGIVPIFSNGNSGPGCCSVGSPAHLNESIGVGSITEKNALSQFSSRGPVAKYRIPIINICITPIRMKPDISGPGSDIFSAWHTGNSNYNTISGTSMSAPHVTGVVALIAGANKTLTVAQARDILLKGASTKGLIKGTQCSQEGNNEYPNNQFGYGCVNAVNSINLVLGI